MQVNDSGGGLQPTHDPQKEKKPKKPRHHKKPDVDGKTEVKQWVAKEVLVTPDNLS